MRRWLLVVAVLLAACATARAGDLQLPPGAWWDDPQLAARLQLGDGQKERIREVVFEHARRMIDLNADVKRQELTLAHLVGRDQFDAAAVREAFAAFQQARTRLEQERFEMLLAVRQELSPEQWDRLQKLREAHRRMEERRERAPLEGRRPPRPGGRPGV